MDCSRYKQGIEKWGVLCRTCAPNPLCVACIMRTYSANRAHAVVENDRIYDLKLHNMKTVILRVRARGGITNRRRDVFF